MSDNAEFKVTEKLVINQPISLINVIVNEILDIIDKPQSEVAEIKSIHNCLNNHNVTSQEIYNLLLNNRIDSNSIIILADFHFLGIGTSVNKQKAFELFQEAANLGNAFGIFMVG